MTVDLDTLVLSQSRRGYDLIEAAAVYAGRDPEDHWVFPDVVTGFGRLLNDLLHDRAQLVRYVPRIAGIAGRVGRSGWEQDQQRLQRMVDWVVRVNLPCRLAAAGFEAGRLEELPECTSEAELDRHRDALAVAGYDVRCALRGDWDSPTLPYASGAVLTASIVLSVDYGSTASREEVASWAAEAVACALNYPADGCHVERAHELLERVFQ